MTATHNTDAESQLCTKQQAATPLPKFQLFINSLIQLAEPITATVIYPFIPRFVALTGITNGDERLIGYYAGIIESVFFFAESASVYHWARVSDYYGRKPILLLGPLGLALSMLGFGLSKSFWSLVLFRTLQGSFNGLIGVSKTVIAELTDSSNMALAFSLIPIMWGSGVTIGPLIGGVFAEPATKWALFDTPFFREYPYFLPTAIAAAFAFLTTLLAAFTLKETSTNIGRLQEKQHVKEMEESNSLNRLLTENTPTNYGTMESGTQTPVSPILERPPTLREVLHPQFVTVLASYAFLAFLDMSNVVLLPLVYASSCSLGGLGFPPQLIGKLMAIIGIGGAMLQVFLVPHALRVFGERRVFRVSLFGVGTSVTLCFALMSWLVKTSGSVGPWVWIVIGFQLFLSLGSYAAYTSIQIFTVSSAKNKAAMASATSVAQMVACAIRGLAPTIASSLFSVSLSQNLLGGYLVFVVLGMFLVAGLYVSSGLPRRA